MRRDADRGARPDRAARHRRPSPEPRLHRRRVAHGPRAPGRRAGRRGPEQPGDRQELFVTRKTVEHHLGSIYRKLDLESRDQLAGALAAEQ
ncbi:MAG: hypothetical protein GEU88_13980 [Solirubrobacterales bacterium]|nr:hypothetical protein [Solirubrobacterales bacterium]